MAWQRRRVELTERPGDGLLRLQPERPAKRESDQHETAQRQCGGNGATWQCWLLGCWTAAIPTTTEGCVVSCGRVLGIGGWRAPDNQLRGTLRDRRHLSCI